MNAGDRAEQHEVALSQAEYREYEHNQRQLAWLQARIQEQYSETFPRAP